jgi:hypothetical protein
MRALDLEKLKNKAYFSEMIWVTEKLVAPILCHPPLRQGRFRGYLLDDRE